MVQNIAVQLLKEMKADNRLYLNCKALCLVMKQLLHKCTEYLAKPDAAVKHFTEECDLH